ncbi:hypothetical protein Poly59_28470 [Rubripirellula reticaptiva]|uniref:Uncharacterized protein n=1 Tax=Rubripirellula reticaptiva TaxID=2528013 RepID=A0A5C6ERK7_9BACT|nr:hypothetical protein Poly59_28470 [Rubripirellula reticaptiva]
MRRRLNAGRGRGERKNAKDVPVFKQSRCVQRPKPRIADSWQTRRLSKIARDDRISIDAEQIAYPNEFAPKVKSSLTLLSLIAGLAYAGCIGSV